MMEIVFEDDHYLAVNKPAGLLVQGDRTGETSLVDLVKQRQKGGFAGLLHRLDRHVSGLVLFAKSPEAAAGFSELLREQDIVKTYHAVVHGSFKVRSGILEHHLLKKGYKSIVFSTPQPGSKRSELAFEVEEERNRKSGLRIRLLTGRYNQIRAQLAYVRHPIVGDYKYMKESRDIDAIALCAKELEFIHPFSGKTISLSIPFPAHWELFWQQERM
jgi:23S rRNA pseudouridine1911/1915/1917 synthase